MLTWMRWKPMEWTLSGLSKGTGNFMIHLPSCAACLHEIMGFWTLEASCMANDDRCFWGLCSISCRSAWRWHLWVTFQSQNLLPTVSRPVRLGVRHPSGTGDQFLFLLEIFFRQLRVCYFVAPSLTRGRVCNLLLLLVIASAVPLDSRPYFTVLILETPPT
jgi:hypothetical protein